MSCLWKVRKLTVLQQKPCRSPLVHCSSKCMRQPVVKNAGAITPTEAESLSTTKPRCHRFPLLLPLFFPLVLSLLPVGLQQPERALLMQTPKVGQPMQQTTTASVTLEKQKASSARRPVCLSRDAVTTPSLTTHVTSSLTSLTSSSPFLWMEQVNNPHILYKHSWLDYQCTILFRTAPFSKFRAGL